mgnify:CR=1 FL=1
MNEIKKDNDYKKWISEVSRRFKSSQIKAAIKANDEMIRFYWSLGHDMDEKKVTYSWGSHFYAQISADLKKELPDVKSFSPRNLLYMHQFYRLFPITQQLVSQNDIDNEILQSTINIPVGPSNKKDILGVLKHYTDNLNEQDYIELTQEIQEHSEVGAYSNTQIKNICLLAKTGDGSNTKEKMLELIKSKKPEIRQKNIDKFKIEKSKD